MKIDYQGVALGLYLFAFLLSVLFGQLTVGAEKKVDRVLFGLGCNMMQFSALMMFGWLLCIHLGAVKP